MRKKDLLNQIKYLTQKVLEADKTVKSLNDDILDKEEEIRRLNEKIEAMEASYNEKPLEETISEQNEAEETIENDVSVPEMKYEDFNFAKESINEELDDANDYAVKAISRIITESVKIGCVLASGDNPNKKELLNLTLGRTEVAKNEISSLIETNLSNAEKIKAIDNEENQVKEYYQSILAQL